MGPGRPSPEGGPGVRSPSGEDLAGPASIVIQRRIEWSDTDASSAYHNTAAFRLMEAAETALVERLGFLEDIYGRHPRVRIEAEFVAPLWFRDIVDVSIRVVGVGRTSVTYEVEITRDGVPCMRGRMVAVLLDRIGGTPQAWPDDYRRSFLRAGPQRPERLG
jgi:YbgC/YbaW family acyl-CoA thioester hydrolase